MVISISSKDLGVVILLRVVGGAGGLRGSLGRVLWRWFDLVYEVSGRRMFVSLFLEGSIQGTVWLMVVVMGGGGKQK